ncbi:MAG: hypothetical protein ABW169_09495 [Sphingobium sp.]
MRHDPVPSPLTIAQPASDADRAFALLNGHIARIDAALAFMRQRKASYLPSIYETLFRRLNIYRRKCDWYLTMRDSGGKAALGWMGENGHGPTIDAAIRDADFFANATRYVPPALRGKVGAA